MPLLEGDALPSVFEDDGEATESVPAVDNSGKFKGGAPPPFKVLGEKGVERDDDERAVNGDQPLYDYFDANQTMTAAFLHEDARLSTPRPNADSPSTFEKLGRGLPALFGLTKKHSIKYGKANVSFDGPDPATGAVHDLVHGLGGLLKHPDETRRLLEVLRIGMREHESELTQLVDVMLQMNELGKQPEYEGAAMVGEIDGMPGSPHRFWDDLIGVAERISRRKGMVEALIRMITADATRSAGPDLRDLDDLQGRRQVQGRRLLARPSRRHVHGPGPGRDLNEVATVTYKTEVDRNAPDIGENRSVWQRTMSLIHHLRNRKMCNKDGSTLHLLRNLGGITLPLRRQRLQAVRAVRDSRHGSHLQPGNPGYGRRSSSSPTSRSWAASTARFRKARPSSTGSTTIRRPRPSLASCSRRRTSSARASSSRLPRQTAVRSRHSSPTRCSPWK